MPKVFISYSWEDNEHKSWVRDLAISLRKDGVEIILDQWNLILGDSLTEFMESSISKSDYVLIICTPNYKMKADKRIGGVGYEESIITAQAMYGCEKTKFIPILRRGNWRESAPVWLMDRMYEDLSGQPYAEENYIHLLAAIHNIEIALPPVGQVPIEKINRLFNNIDLSKEEEAALNSTSQKKREKEIVNRKRLNSVDDIMFALKEAKTTGECKVLDYELSGSSDEKRIKYYLFNGNQRQRNYAALYFRRRNNYALLELAYRENKIDKVQAFAK